MTVLFSNSSPKNPNQAFLVPNLEILIFDENLKLNRFEGADFKYDNIGFKRQRKNTQIRQFWSQILALFFLHKIFAIRHLGIFIFLENFGMRQIRGCWFQIWQYYYQLPAPKYPNQALLVSNLRILFLQLTLQQDKFEYADIKYDNFFGKFQPRKTQIRYFWSLI